MAVIRPETEGYHDSATEIDFCTLGMFIIDEIHFLPPKPPVMNILGGAGSFAALGARIVTEAAASKSIGWIVDAGSDFPEELRHIIDSWATSCLVRETPERKTTRGWNGYDDYEQRAFKYLAPRLRLDQNSLNGRLLRSKSFHLICSPTRCIELVHGLQSRRMALGIAEPPLLVWEPLPDTCTPAELGRCKQAVSMVDVVSPNHTELCNHFSMGAHDEDGQVNKETIEQCCQMLTVDGIGLNGRGSIVVRSGKLGCYAALGRDAANGRWIPAFHEEQSKVIDPTGGGNSFLGGLAASLARSRATERNQQWLEEGVVFGSVAASFAIEQIGMPVISVGSGGRTLVNGVAVDDRLRAMRARIESG